jgi:hypothetical protein
VVADDRVGRGDLTQALEELRWKGTRIRQRRCVVDELERQSDVAFRESRHRAGLGHFICAPYRPNRLTVNDDPPSDKRVATAAFLPRCGAISRRNRDHAVSAIVPVCASTPVVAFVNLALPKSASGRGAQLTKHADGASTIHSAESVSGARIQMSVEKELPVESFRSESPTIPALTLTDAVRWSPGPTIGGSSTGGAGKSWYYAE